MANILPDATIGGVAAMGGQIVGYHFFGTSPNVSPDTQIWAERPLSDATRFHPRQTGEDLAELELKAVETTARSSESDAIRYPRRRAIRWVMRNLAGIAFLLVCDLRITGRENIPRHGPVILVANHFHYADPAAVIWASRRQTEFVGGFRFFVGPKLLHILPGLWGIITAFRGGYSRQTLELAGSVLGQGGVLAIFPEGGAWATVLRPPRRGSAYLALQSGVPVIPVGIDGLNGLFRSVRPRVTIRIGEPIGPFVPAESARSRRTQIDEVGEAMMRAVAALVPEERRGMYSDDPRLRAEAEKVADFPFEKAGMRGL